MKMMKLLSALCVIVFAGVCQAETLWNNGLPNGSQGLNNQYQSVMDDFYVPSGGWFINGAETYGIFLNANREVTNITMIIWPADTETGEPNGDNTISLDVNSFQAVETGEYWEGYEKIQINVQFDSTYLEGQEYFWIEFDVRDQYGERIKFIDRQPTLHMPAHIRSNPYPFSSVNQDLAFKLYGSEVSVIDRSPADKFAPSEVDTDSRTVSLYLSGAGKAFDPGFYQIQMIGREPVLYRFSREGKKRIAFRPKPDARQAMSTPLGDDMCRNAPSLIQSYCQEFVACAAYEICN